MSTKLIVAHNLAELRKSRGITQGELAAKFSYSDKSVSKWEHGETLPDIDVLKQLCDFYGVNLDYLVTEHDPLEKKKAKRKRERVANKWVIVGLSVSVVWLLGIVAYITGQIILGDVVWPMRGWICYIWPIPASFVVMLVFNGLWGRSLWRTWLAVALTWSTIGCLYVTLGLFLPDMAGWQLWPMFLIGIPLTVAAILWNHLLSKPQAEA